VRRKGKYVNDTFLRRKDAEERALEVERRVDRGEPSSGYREARTFGDLSGFTALTSRSRKRIGRSKTASLTLLEHRLARSRLPELDRRQDEICRVEWEEIDQDNKTLLDTLKAQ
jgi:hypothetical protein